MTNNPHGQWVPDPLAPSGYRWRRHNEPTRMMPATPPSGEYAMARLLTPQIRAGGTIRYDEFEDHQLSGQDDLSDLDESAGELVNTEKIGPLDEVLVQPTQDPFWRPPGETA